MKQYLDLLRYVRENGKFRADRTGTGTYSVFGPQLEVDLSEGFPLLTTKKMHLKSIIHELLWMLSGDTNIHYLQNNGVRIWNEWADENGDLGPVYGHQWRHFDGPNGTFSDQITQVVEQIKNNPNSRRLIVSSWNPTQVDDMQLPPCHCFYQFYVCDGELSLKLYQRSADMFLGVPFNIASYTLLTMLVAQECNLIPAKFIHTFGDAHIYANHLEQVDLQLSREPFVLPKMEIVKKSLLEHTIEDFNLVDYVSHPTIKAVVSV